MRSVSMSGDIGQLAARPRACGILLAATGFSVWTGLSVWGGVGSPDGFRLREAWDTTAYFSSALPMMALAVAAASFVQPRRVWRWPLWLVAGHQLGVLLVGLGMQSGLSLILLTLMLAILLATFFAIPALIGSMAARRFMQRAY